MTGWLGGISVDWVVSGISVDVVTKCVAVYNGCL